MTARTGSYVTETVYFGNFSHTAFASYTTETIYYSNFSRASFAGYVPEVVNFSPFTQARNGAWSRQFNSGWLPDLENPMSVVQVLQNTATTFSVFMRDASSGLGLPGIAPSAFTIKLKKSNQVVFSVITPTITETGNGWYDLALTTAHTDTYGKAPLEVAAAGAATRDDIVLDVIALNKFTDPVRAGLTALPNAIAATPDGLPTAEMVTNIAVTGAALNTIAATRVITTGTEGGVLANTDALDNVFHTITAVGGVIDFYYQFDVSATLNAVGVSAQWKGYFNSEPFTINVYAWNWTNTAWDQLGVITASNDTVVYSGDFALTNSYTSAGLVRIRFSNTGITGGVFATDRILLGYVVTASTPTAIAGNVWDLSRTGHQTVGSFGEVLPNAAAAAVGGLPVITAVGQGPGGQIKANSFNDKYVYDTQGRMTSMRNRVFANKATADTASDSDADGAHGEVERYRVTVTYNTDSTIKTYEYAKEL